MLTITIPGVEDFDEVSNEFITQPETTIDLEHSLISLSKWESDWKKPFLSSDNKTTEETIGYVRSMTLTPNIPEEIYQRLSHANVDAINNYIDDKMSATWFREATGAPSREIITSEVIYYWLVTLQVPFDCENWHLNRLFTLIKVANQKNTPEKKMSARDLAVRNRELNEKRKAQMNTSG